MWGSVPEPVSQGACRGPPPGVRAGWFVCARVVHLQVRMRPGRWLYAAGVCHAPRPGTGVSPRHRRPAVLSRGLRPGPESELSAEIAAQQRPTSLLLFETPSGPAAWHALRSWYAVSAHDRAIDPALQRFMAERAGSTTVRFAAASHVGGLTHYRARFVKLIEQAAEATAM